jgi:hypothetical protein
MADDPNETKKKRPGWHLRPFSEALKRKCGGRAREQGVPEYQWVTEVLCKELGIAVESLAALDSKLKSENEDRQGTIRPGAPKDVVKAAAEDLRNKSRKEKRKA